MIKSKERQNTINEFLEKNNLSNAIRFTLSSDASFRSYERISGDAKSLMLMDAPPEKEDIEPFINMANYLKRRGFSAPEIYAVDVENGLMLLEDIGDDSFTNVLSGKSPLSDKYSEMELYQAAIDVLIQLDRSTLPTKTPEYDGELLMRECKLLTHWYLPNLGQTADIASAFIEYEQIWQQLLQFNKISDDVVVLRDYHADNLMWLPERCGVENVGLLDFQDAVIGSPVYDIVSLLEDARRDVSRSVVEQCKKHYLNNRKSIDKKDFDAAYAILAAQRNCKIIGIFARLALRDSKPKYLDYLPRVWGHLESGLWHPALIPLRNWLDKNIPPKLRKKDAIILSGKEYAVG